MYVGSVPALVALLGLAGPRRRQMIFFAGLVVFADSYSLFLAGMAISGAGLGVYLGVDFALATDALPNKDRDAAKDLGLFNIANALPQSIAPVLASLILVGTSGSYPAVFAAAGMVALFSAAAIAPVKRS